MRKKLSIENDLEMNHTLVRLLIEVSESLRRDFSSMSEGTSYSTVRRVRRHITNMRKILKDMSAATKDKKEKIVEAQWGGEVPSSYYRRTRNQKKKSESEPLIL